MNKEKYLEEADQYIKSLSSDKDGIAATTINLYNKNQVDDIIDIEQRKFFDYLIMLFYYNIPILILLSILIIKRKRDQITLN
ncbi:MAG: hypothetical protein WCD89_10045 [Anaerocolumna sp.]